MFRDHSICRCCAGRMAVTSATNPNVCPGCEQILENGPSVNAALLVAKDASKEELMESCPNLKVASFTI